MQTVAWKILLSIVLFISFIFFSISVVASLQNRDIPVPPDQAGAEKKQAFPMPARDVRFYPAVPARLPDLSEGYLFNQERKIQPAETADTAAADDAVVIDVDEVRYAGSLIVGSRRRGLIRYPVAAMPINRQARSRVTVPGRKTVTAKWSSRIVEEGETVSGYRVVSISPEALVFEKGGSKVEKKLYDPAKERVTFTPPMNRSKPAPKTAVRKTNRTYQPGTKARPASTSRARTPVTNRTTVRR